jgi:hypothetical protein
MAQGVVRAAAAVASALSTLARVCSRLTPKRSFSLASSSASSTWPTTYLQPARSFRTTCSTGQPRSFAICLCDGTTSGLMVRWPRWLRGLGTAHRAAPQHQHSTRHRHTA